MKLKALFFLIFFSFLGTEIFAMSDEENFPTDENVGMRTPVRKKREKGAADPDYLPEVTRSAEKRETVARSVIHSGTVESWPSLWESHGWDRSFLQNLAALKSLSNGATLLHIAMALNPSNSALLDAKVRCIDELIDGGASLEVRDDEGNTPLHKWVQKPRSEQEIGRVGEVLSHAFRRGLDFDSIRDTSNNNTPMHVICSTGLENIHMFNLFMDLGFDLRLLGAQNQSILHRLALACPCSLNEAICKRLIELLRNDFYREGFSDALEHVVNQRDAHGRTALHYVCMGWRRSGSGAYSFNLPLFELLSEISTINVNVRDNEDNTPLDYIKGKLRTKSGVAARKIHDKLEDMGAI